MPDDMIDLPLSERCQRNADFFSSLGSVLQEWDQICRNLSESCSHNDRKEFLEHYRRLRDTDAVLALGYVRRHEELTGDRMPQAKVIEVLTKVATDECELPKRSRAAVGMEIGRRYRALHYFGLVERREVTRTFVDLRLTDLGHQTVERINRSFASALGPSDSDDGRHDNE